MNITDIEQTYDPSRGTPEIAAVVLTATIGGATFEGVGLSLSQAMADLLVDTKAWRDRLNAMPDGYLNERTLALKIALNDF